MSIKDINYDVYEDEVSEGVVLVDFHAKWCSPCKMMNSVLKDLNDEIGDKAKIIKLDIDECDEDFLSDLSILSVPTFLVYKDGKITERFYGFNSKDKILDLMNI